jgi:hypothetical protein
VLLSVLLIELQRRRRPRSGFDLFSLLSSFFLLRQERTVDLYPNRQLQSGVDHHLGIRKSDSLALREHRQSSEGKKKGTEEEKRASETEDLSGKRVGERE